MIPPLIEPNRSLILNADFGTNPGLMSMANGEVQRNFAFCYPNGDQTLAGNHGAEWYDLSGAHHIDTPTSLKLKADLTPGRTIAGTTAWAAADAGAITSAMLATRQVYGPGYYELRAKMPAANCKGAFPALWLTRGVSPPTSWWGPEIDIVELAYNLTPDGSRNPFFGKGQGPQPSIEMLDPPLVNEWNSWSPGVDCGGDFHIYGLEWLKYKMRDGTRIDRWRRNFDRTIVSDMLYAWTFSNGLDAGKAHFYIDLSYGGQSWAGRNGIDPTALPAIMEIDYVRAFA